MITGSWHAQGDGSANSLRHAQTSQDPEADQESTEAPFLDRGTVFTLIFFYLLILLIGLL